MLLDTLEDMWIGVRLWNYFLSFQATLALLYQFFFVAGLSFTDLPHVYGNTSLSREDKVRTCTEPIITKHVMRVIQ